MEDMFERFTEQADVLHEFARVIAIVVPVADAALCDVLQEVAEALIRVGSVMRKAAGQGNGDSAILYRGLMEGRCRRARHSGWYASKSSLPQYVFRLMKSDPVCHTC